jgi:two-component system, NarL family, nitrate/nitrite response regulator NarL
MMTLLIIDDHPLISDGIKAMVKDLSEFSVVGSCKKAVDALHFLDSEKADIILVDISLPDMNGIQLCKEIRKKDQTAKLIALTSSNDASIISSFLKSGGNGYLLKNMEQEELILAIETVMKGKIYLSKAANEKILEQLQNLNHPTDGPRLTRREKEILQLLSDGLKGPQIARKLFLSYHTIETHRKNLLKKFNANSVQMLLRNAREHIL